MLVSDRVFLLVPRGEDALTEDGVHSERDILACKHSNSPAGVSVKTRHNFIDRRTLVCRKAPSDGRTLGNSK